ncbi:hypothetical protein ACLGIH_14370 [Streptomyces sp. HMX87]|uniref:hypothetical protein n=1 Tax=Streptomyces sp. HMX87 TaxID=3390849 RepID=UPI003A8A0D0F
MATKRIALGCAVLVLALAGCGTQRAGDAAGGRQPAGAAAAAQPVTGVPLSSVPTAPTKGLAKGLTLPLDEYTYSARDRYAWQMAVQQGWRACMQRYGFAGFGPPPPPAGTVTTQAESDMGRRYGITDLAGAQKHGYHLEGTAESPHWEPAPGAETAVFTGAGPELSEGTYDGKEVPEGGCRGEVGRQFPLPRSTEAEKAEMEAFEESRDDSRVVTAVAAWSACMEKKGYRVEHPFDAPDLVNESLSAPEPSAEEIRLASADVACKGRTGLVPAWHEAETERQRSKISEHRAGLSENKKAKDAAVAKAVTAYEQGAK